MPKIRSLKRGYFRSRTVKKMTRPARLTLAGVIATMTDDDGRFVADSRLVRTEVYPWDDDVTDAEVESHLSEAASKAVGLIRFYRTGGARYACFPKWRQHQWISHHTPSTLPPPPERRRKNSGASPAVHARALDEGEGSKDGDEGKGQDDLSRKGRSAASKKLTIDDPMPDVGIPIGKGHAVALEILKAKGFDTTQVLKRMDPTERTAAQEEAARQARGRRARVSA